MKIRLVLSLAALTFAALPAFAIGGYARGSGDLSVYNAAVHAQAAPEVREAAKKYTCPMHPEVTSDKPGKCPKCGMTLVPAK